MGIIEEHLRGISSLMLELQQILAECARNAKAGVSSGNVMPAGKPEADTKQGVEPTYSRPLPPSPGSYPSLDIEVAEQPSQQVPYCSKRTELYRQFETARGVPTTISCGKVFVLVPYVDYMCIRLRVFSLISV